MAALALAAVMLASPRAAHAQWREAPEFWFNRCVTHWGEIDQAFVDYVLQVRPQIVIVSFWGPTYYSGRGYAIEQDKEIVIGGIGGGHRDQAHRRQLIRQIQDQGIKVVGLFSQAMLYGDVEQGRGFFAYLDKYWEEDLLGPRVLGPDGEPVAAARLIQVTKDGPFKQNWYNIEGGSEYKGCPSNPYYREVLKRFVRAGIDHGLDGFQVVFPHKEDCICGYCQAGFKGFLRKRYTDDQIREKFDIDDLATHHFDSLTGWYEPEDASPLRHEMLRFSQMLIQDCKRDVLIDYGRQLKPDLLVGQWNHMYRSSMEGPGQIPGTFAQLNADEQCVLPTERWSRAENWVWYSIGAWHLYWKPAEGDLAQFSLAHKYLREAGRGLPQAVKRDDGKNVAVYIAEAVAHGGFAYARGPNYQDADTVKVVQTYFDFLREHEDLYRPVESAAKVALVFPRTSVHKGDKSPVYDFKHLGHLLTRAHVAYDVVVDQQFTDERRAQYDIVLEPQADALTPADDPDLAAALERSLVDAGPTFVTTLWQTPDRNRLILHLVNHGHGYEPSELNLPAEQAQPETLPMTVALPSEAKAAKVRQLSPERPEAQDVPFEQAGQTLRFTSSPAGAYTVLVIDLQ